MIAVIFEVTPKEGHQGPYLDMAARMKEHLEGFEGFISVERFQSLTTPGKLLSLSFWEDEEAVQRWRKLTAHRGAQEMGRQRFFADYRLRVAPCAARLRNGRTRRGPQRQPRPSRCNVKLLLQRPSPY